MENSKEWRNVLLGLAAVIAFLLWFRRSKPAPGTEAQTEQALGVPTVSAPSFTPTYLNYNQAPFNVEQFPTLTFSPVIVKSSPLVPSLPRGISNPKLPAPACGCHKGASPRELKVTVFGSSDDLANYFSSDPNGEKISAAWAANTPTDFIQ